MGLWIGDGGGGGSPPKIEDVYSSFDKALVKEIIGRHVTQACPTGDLLLSTPIDSPFRNGLACPPV